MLQIDQTTAATIFFLQKEINCSMEYLKLIKLLYLTDRRMLDTYDNVITGDRYVLMKHGPILSAVYALIKIEELSQDMEDVTGSQLPADVWHQYLEINSDKHIVQIKESMREKAAVFMEEHVDDDAQEICTYISKEYQHLEQGQIVKKLHDLPEWQRHIEELECNPAIFLPIAELADVLGKEPDDIVHIVFN